MYEIELKARITDRETLIRKLNNGAVPGNHCFKSDTYWQHPVSRQEIRIRRERLFSPAVTGDGSAASRPGADNNESSKTQGDSDVAAQLSVRNQTGHIPVTQKDSCTNTGKDTFSETVTVTYKRKHLNTDPETGTSYEVNDEHEFTISSSVPFEAFLQDAGFAVSITKEKDVYSWHQDGALLELCSVPPLGNFLEIEILTEDRNESTVAAARNRLNKLLEEYGIPAGAVERRYYSEMLAEILQTSSSKDENK